MTTAGARESGLRASTRTPAQRRSTRLGRYARRRALTGRLLTELQVWRLSQLRGPAEFAVCRALAAPGSLAIDIGASVGNYTRALAKAVGHGGRVLAVEPNPAVFAELVRSTWSARVTAVNLAASAENGWVRLRIPVGPDGETQDQLGTVERRDAGDGRSYDVRAVRLDDIIPAGRPVSLLKIDVEGHELDVLRGAIGTLHRHRPSLVVEIERRHLVDRGVEDVVGWVLDLGYVCFALRHRVLMPWAEFDLERHQTAWLRAHEADPRHPIAAYVNNFVFLPSEHATALIARAARALGGARP